MDKDFLNYIRTLSIRDKKPLSQKTLKLMEEVGELSKKVLPYDHAFATTHRYVQKDKILEEACDIMLCSLSILYDLEIPDKEINDMLYKKSDKWDKLQRKELHINYPIPYEIHITVRDADIDEFKTACNEIGAKPIILDLQNTTGTSILKDVMTSSTFVGNNTNSYEECKRVSNELTKRGFKVVREKIETVPWHPSAPSNEVGNQMPNDCYFESHFGVLVNNEKEKEILKNIAIDYKCHLSRNVFKKNEETGSEKVMMTFRKYNNTYENFKEEVEIINNALHNNRFEVDKTIIEFSIYDTNITHDKNWMEDQCLT